jgi:hypothetical protein
MCYNSVVSHTSAAAPKLDTAKTRLLWLHQRLGKPQVYALLLLLAFTGQCFWLAAHSRFTTLEMGYLSPAHATDTGAQASGLRSPLVAFVASLPTRAVFPTDFDAPFWRMVLRAPFIFVGALLGASLWYVARRLYGNAGGYVALMLYAFSPPMVLRWSSIAPDVIAAWGTFGCIFTGIAVAHTLYAPREVVLWNWRRILLLGISMGLAAAAIFPTVVAVPITLAFMFYLVPHRRGAALAILAAACALALLILLASYSFHLSQLASVVHAGNPFRFTAMFLSRRVASALFGGLLLRNGPAFVTLVVLAVGAYAGWRKTRFFGTTAPLLVAFLFGALAVSLAHQNVMAFLWIALPFLMVFTAGVCADLLELRTAWSPLLSGFILAVLIAHAFFSISGLWRIAH